MKFIKNVIDLKDCLDFDCSMIYKNRKMLHDRISNLIIEQLNKSISVRDIENSIHNINEYVVIPCFIGKKLSNNSNHLIKFIMKIHLIDDFKANILISTDVMKSQKMNLFFVNNILIIDVCKNLKISIDTIVKTNFNNRRIIRARHVIIIFSHITVEIVVIYQNIDKQQSRLFNNRDYFFESQCLKQIELNEDDEMFVHIIDVSMFKVLARNITDRAIELFKRCRLNIVIDYKQTNCYQLILNVEFLASSN